jgi:hypothetical protein
MDQEDPEKRIAELERRPAEARAAAHPEAVPRPGAQPSHHTGDTTTVAFSSAASRQFVAHGPFWGSKVASKTTPAWQNNPGMSYLFMIAAVVGFSVVVGGLYLGVQSYSEGQAEWIQAIAGEGFIALLFVLLIVGTVVWYLRSQRKILISVTSDGLTVNKRPGDVYSFNDAKLGTWGVTGGPTMGAALHLQCGPRRFIVGGRDHRVAAGTRLEAPDVGYGQSVDVDARVSASDFKEILAMASLRSGLDVRAPAPGEPTRCLVYPNPLLMQETGPFAFRKRQELYRSLSQPSLAIDVGDDAIRVIDPKINAVIASVSPAQVTARPLMYRPSSSHLFPTAGHVISDFMGNYLSRMPYMVVSVPGMQPLTIGCRDTVSGVDHRFSWRADVPVQNERPDYAVLGADWLTLVEKFGLAAYLEEKR